MSAPLNVVLLSCGLLGFRHGFDYDHIAAIADIAGVRPRAGDTMRLGLMYALGHAATVALLGGVVIGFQLALPQGMAVGFDLWAERLVGATLIVLSVYVFSTLIRTRGQGVPRSRGAMIVGAGRWVQRRVHRWITGRRFEQGTTAEVNAGTCFGIGVIHGLGAETPSQLGLFLLAANMGGVQRGLLGLGVFLLGLLAMNAVMTASAAGLFRVGRGWGGWAPVMMGVTAAYSFGIGVVFLLGRSGMLRNISG